MELAQRLKSAREKLALSQSQASKTWEIPIKTLQSWEQGVRTPSGLAFRQLETILAKAERSAGQPGRGGAGKARPHG